MIHEMIHILSAQGGQTKILADYGAGLNEGFTHMFTKKACAWDGITVNAAYEGPTEFVEALERKYGTPLLYDAYFKDKMDLLLDAMVSTWDGYVTAGQLGNGARPPWGDRNSDQDKKKIDLIKKLKDWTSTRSWLDPRIL